MLKRVFVSPQTGKLGGVNLLDDPKRIGDGELAWAKNTWPTTPGIIGLRGSTFYDPNSYVNVTIGGNEWAGSPPILYVKPPSTIGGDGIIVTRRTQTADTYSNTTVRVIDSIAGTTLANGDMGVVTKRRPGAYFYDNKYYVFAGYGANSSGKIVRDIGAGLEIANFVFANSPGIQPALACQYRSKFVYGNFGPGYENTIIFSDDGTRDTVAANALAADGRNFVIGSSADGDMVALVPVMLTAVGSPAQQGLLILHEYAAHLLTGQPNDSDDATAPLYGDVTIARISFNCGCASAESVVTTPYGVIWAGHDDVWLFSAGQVPVRIGSKIRPALAQTPAALRYLWHAAYFNGSYRLAVLSAGQGANDDSPCGDQWWLDLREGAPQNHEKAVWWGPQQFQVPSYFDGGGTLTECDPGTRAMTVDTRPGMPTTLCGLDLRGDNLILLTYDAPQVRDGEGFGNPELLADSEIVLEIITKDYDFDDSNVDKLWYGLEINIWAGYSMQLSVEDTMDGGDLIDEGEVTVSQLPFMTNLGRLE